MSTDNNDKPKSRIGLKQVSSQPSIFDSMPKKPSQEDFDQQVKQVQAKSSDYKGRAAELAVQFNKLMADKTLSVNKNLFQQEIEKELLIKMIKLAQEINQDPNERESEGSLMWIIVLIKTCFAQKDKINQLEYVLLQLKKQLIEPEAIKELIIKEIAALDKPSNSG